MSRIDIILNNNKTITTLIFFIVISIMSPIVNYILLPYIPISDLKIFLEDYIVYIYITIPFAIYFTVSGVYCYIIKIDPYVINIISYSIWNYFSNKEDFIDISHDMLEDYALFDRAFSFNKILMLKIKKQNGKIIIKRFYLTGIREKEIATLMTTLTLAASKNN